ncbi:FAD-dependent monooxygenase [Kibdelosporangium philippinense]|uniref:FAD-dependent monooxygenase n=1 Tax=Kibdelosporangium philippinense TaxID=211113 RepID=A0ABS8Z275_9PSEU|nr:FAD-dependent monooxygenase [Kibdelosporangium philippinense]MCE7001875.1 FAD-dependent monooxygenase [Kibdelosporangium philippinense]
MKVLISGASISGPVLAYWLARYDFEVTVVERSPVLRKTGGHAIDLFRPAMDITEKMGVLPEVEKRITGIDRLRLYRRGVVRPTKVNLGKIYQAASDRHVEIMRDDLSEIYYEATANEVDYIFGDSITGIGEDGKVTFENSAPRKFDIVVGADGLHSNVRKLTFGEVPNDFLGAYLAVATMPKDFGPEGEFLNYVDVGRMAGIYSATHLEDARAVFLFRSQPLDYHYRDVPRQKELLKQAFQRLHPEVSRWLEELDRSPAFYFDSITQLKLETWSRGRVTLVGDAGYCPGPAVGGSTSLAVVGAYVLAGELATAKGDYERAFTAYEREMAGYVQGSRQVALLGTKTLIPTSPFGVWALANGARAISALPVSVSRLLSKLNKIGTRLHDEFVVKNYDDLRTG